jgi:hypothetical protein
MNIEEQRTGALICPNAVSGAAGCSKYSKKFTDKLWLAKHVWNSPACLQRLGSNFWSSQWFPPELCSVCDYCRDIQASTNTSHVASCAGKAQQRSLEGQELALCFVAMQRAKHNGWLCFSCYELHLNRPHVCSWSERASRKEFIEQVQVLSNRDGTHCEVLCCCAALQLTCSFMLLSHVVREQRLCISTLWPLSANLARLQMSPPPSASLALLY